MIAHEVLPGIPRVRVGRAWPPAFELAADSANITPSTDPLPKLYFSLSFVRLIPKA